MRERCGKGEGWEVFSVRCANNCGNMFGIRYFRCGNKVNFKCAYWSVSMRRCRMVECACFQEACVLPEANMQKKVVICTYCGKVHICIYVCILHWKYVWNNVFLLWKYVIFTKNVLVGKCDDVMACGCAYFQKSAYYMWRICKMGWKSARFLP